MGNNLQIIKENIEKIEELDIFNLSLTKLREYHGTFKSVCENFSMDYTEFKEIFNESEDTFKLWDNNDNGLIDSLELFSGLILFSNSQFQEKIRFLFDLFDFNELNSLSIVDIEFMLNCCVASTFRICKSMAEVNQDEISKFVNQNLQKENRVNISQLIKFCCNAKEINEYLTIIKRHLPFKEKLSFNEFVLKLENPDYQIPKFFNIKKQGSKKNNVGEILNSNSHIKKTKFLSDFIKKMKLNQNQTNFIKRSSIKLNWVYGFRCSDLLKAFDFHQNSENDLNPKIIYFVANLVIIYYYKQNTQTHFLEHKSMVYSLSIGKIKNIIATGDSGKNATIYVWDINTLKVLKTIKNKHSLCVYELSLIKNDEMLVSLSLRHNTPILVYDINSKNTLLCCCLDNFIRGIRPIDIWVGDSVFKNKKDKGYFHWDLESSFFAFSSFKFYFFAFRKSIQSYEKFTFWIRDEESIVSSIKNSSPEISCLTSFYINLKCPDLLIYGNQKEYDLVVVTGHTNGEVVLWLNFKNPENIEKKVIIDYKKGINKIINYDKKYLIILTKESKMFLWDLYEEKYLKEFDLTLLPVRLKSFEIKTIVKGNKKNLFFSTLEGDLVKMSLNHKKKWKKNLYVETQKAKRFNNIIQLKNKFNTMSILEREDEKLIFIGGEDSQIYGFSTNDHDLIDKWSIGDSVTTMDCLSTEDGGIIFAFGTEKGKIVLRYDWEEFPKSFQCGKKILDIKFSPNCSHIVATSENQFIYIFRFSNGSYFEFPHKEIYLDKEIPISINFSFDFKSVIIGTNKKNHYKLDLPDSKNTDYVKTIQLIKEEERIHITKMKMKYPIFSENKEINSVPLLFGQDIKLILGGDENGALIVWNNEEELSKNSGTLYFGHSSKIVDINISKNKDYLYTLAENDNALFEWKIDFEMDSFEKQNIKEDSESNIIDRELLSCTSFDKSFFILKDSLALFKGCSHTFLNNINRERYQKIYNEKEVTKRYSPFSLELEHVYGFNCYDKRFTLAYVHYNKFEKDEVIEVKSKPSLLKSFMYAKKNTLNTFQKESIFNKKDSFYRTLRASLLKSIAMSNFSKNKERSSDLDKSILIEESIEDDSENSEFESNYMNSEKEFNETLKLSKIYKQDELLNNFLDLMINDNQELKFDEGFCDNSTSCNREFVYITSRIAIVLNPKKPHIQKFYEGHKEKISCLTVHPNKNIVATGEAANNPKIHIWLTNNCTNLRIINTDHKLGILILKFSFEKNYLYSVGVDKQISLQVTDWKNNKIIAFRFALSEKIVSLDIHPENPEIFVTGSLGRIDFWRVKGNCILHDNTIKLNDIKLTPFITNLKFISYYLGNKKESDLFITTNIGNIYLIRKNKYIKCDNISHKNMINCFSTFYIKDKLFFATGGEDKLIIIFDITLKPLVKINLEEIMELKDTSLAIQSLDFYLCKGETRPIFLIGTRGGHMIELKLKYNINNEDKETFVILENNLIIKNHAAQNIERSVNPLDFRNYKKVFVACHPKQPIIVTVGDDKVLYFWNYHTRKPLLSKNLTYFPTVCKFSPDGKNLVVGFDNGILKVFEPKISGSGKIGNPQNIDLNSEPFVIEGKDTKTAILNIEFSLKGDLMAVSYDNVKVNLEKEDVPKEKGGSFGLVFISQNSKDNKKLYEQYREIRLPSRYETQKTMTNIFGMAIHDMSFSEDNNYLMVYFQKIDNFQVRENRDREGVYSVWDLKSDTNVINWDILKDVQFKKNNFPTHIYGIYQLYPDSEDLFKNGDENVMTEDLSKNKIVLSAIEDNIDYSFLGSIDGDLFVVKNSFLYMKPDSLPENANIDEFVQAKRYPSHCSFVNDIQMAKRGNETKLFTTGIFDEAVFQWRIKNIEKEHELDHLDPNIKNNDLFLFEVESKEKFQNFIHEINPTRNQIVEISQDIDEGVFPKIRLETYKIFGRKSFDRRNNLLISKNKQIIYSSGSYLVLFHLHNSINKELKKNKNLHKNKIEQFFITPEKMRVPSEISALAICPNRTYILYGTKEINSQFTLMDITSKSIIKTFQLTGLVTPLIIRFSSDSRNCVILGITSKYQASIYFIDVFKGKKMAVLTLAYSLVFKIKDIQFVPQINNEFITVGIQHLSLWKYKANNLEFEECRIEKKNDKIKKNDLEGYEGIENNEEFLTSFLAICFLFSHVFVTSCDSGYIYLWHKKRIIQTILVEKETPILVLQQSNDYSTDLIAGLMNGKIIYFRLLEKESNLSLTKLFELDMKSSVSPSSNGSVKKEIQSLIFCEQNHIVYGMRNGDIGEITYNYDFKSFEKIEKQMKAQKIKNRIESEEIIQKKLLKNYSENLLLSFFDDQIPQAFDLSQNETKILIITKKGLFSVYDLESMELKEQIDFKQTSIDMIVLKSKVFIAFERKIIVLKNESPYKPIKSFDIDLIRGINKIIICENQNLMAIALKSQEDYTPAIKLYKIEERNCKKFYEIKTEEIELFDFSKDGLYMIYRDISGRRFCYDLSNPKKIEEIETLGLDYDINIEWLGEGLKLSEKIRNINKYYDEFELTNVIKIDNEAILVTDEIGSIRIFEYPCENTDFYRVYSNHLSFIEISKKGNKFLITSSISDKSVVVWKIFVNDKDDYKDLKGFEDLDIQ